ncbi:hypothetical protein FB645_001813 [Coemansia sp. IMI 203386]|nr:hypothetical protein FB645_001813 [Coemansia sp. IMI 203386]
MRCLYAGILIFPLLCHASIPDNCNLAYWRPRLLGTYLVDSKHMVSKRKSERKISIFDSLASPKRILRPQTEVDEKIIDSRRISVMVDENNIVIDVACF